MPIEAPHEKLKVWQLGRSLAVRIYQLTEKFPASERFGLTAQLRRAAVAIPTNIAEGNARSHRREYIQFCHIARGSIAEVKCLLQISSDLSFGVLEDYAKISDGYNHLGALLQILIQRLNGGK
ncbi:MAG: four helix bundle protein [bacterium]